jgi:hypothetical protein
MTVPGVVYFSRFFIGAREEKSQYIAAVLSAGRVCSA